MRLKWCGVGLVAAALLTGLVWYWHASATYFPWSYIPPLFAPSVKWEGLSPAAYLEARTSWREYRRLHDAIDLILLHATCVLATVAAITLVGWAGRAAMRSIGRAPARVASRAVAALRNAPTALGALVLLIVVAVGIANYLRSVWFWGRPHPAVRRLREISDARKALDWPLDNGLTTAEVKAAVPDHELTPQAVSEGLAAALRERPSGYRDTDSFYLLKPPRFHGDLCFRLQFRDDRLINFNRLSWEKGLRAIIAGTEPITISYLGD